MDSGGVYPNQLIFVTKFLPKLTHQLLSLALKRNLKKVKIMKIISEWPKDSRFWRKPYRGLAIAEVEVDASDIYIGYDGPPRPVHLIQMLLSAPCALQNYPRAENSSFLRAMRGLMVRKALRAKDNLGQKRSLKDFTSA